MRWDQIETEWTAMTRRIRADWRNEQDGMGPAATSMPRTAPAPVQDAAPDQAPADSGADYSPLPTSL